MHSEKLSRCGQRVALNSSRACFCRQVSGVELRIISSCARHCRKNPETSWIRSRCGLRASLLNTRIRRDEYIDDRRYQAGMTNELFGVYVMRTKWKGSLRFLRAPSSENISLPMHLSIRPSAKHISHDIHNRQPLKIV